jgi:hypothetical protein
MRGSIAERFRIRRLQMMARHGAILARFVGAVVASQLAGMHWLQVGVSTPR